MNYNAYNKNSGGRPFPPVLTVVIYLRLTGDKPAALMSHVSLQDSRLQRIYNLLNLNECIDRKGRSCSLLVGCAER